MLYTKTNKNSYKMKGIPLNTRITTALAMACALVMASLSAYDSWSGHHLTPLDPLLYACIGLIVITYCFASAEHPDNETKVGKLIGMEVRLEHLFRINTYLFLGVLIFGVNNEANWIKILHFVFTIAAIIQGYVTIWLWANKKVKLQTHDIGKQDWIWAMITLGTETGIAALVLGFTTEIISLSWGEVGAALPLAIFMFITVKKNKKVKIGETVYIKQDPYQTKRKITGYVVRKNFKIYYLSSKGKETAHYPVEISKNPNPKRKLITNKEEE